MKKNDKGFRNPDEDLKRTWCFIQLFSGSHKALCLQPTLAFDFTAVDAVALWSLIELRLKLSSSKAGHFQPNEEMNLFQRKGIKGRAEIGVICSSEDPNRSPACFLTSCVLEKTMIKQILNRANRLRNKEKKRLNPPWKLQRSSVSTGGGAPGALIQQSAGISCWSERSYWIQSTVITWRRRMWSWSTPAWWPHNMYDLGIVSKGRMEK